MDHGSYCRRMHVRFCELIASSSTNWQARKINEKEKACQIAINALSSSVTEVHNQLTEDHRHVRRSNRNKASLRGIEAASHQPGWRFCGFFRKLRRGRLLKKRFLEVLGRVSVEQKTNGQGGKPKTMHWR